MTGQHRYEPDRTVLIAGTVLVADDDAPMTGGRLAERCPFHTRCGGCGRRLREGWPVHSTNGAGDAFVCCPCWWERTP
jgi:hypothetical protein